MNSHIHTRNNVEEKEHVPPRPVENANFYRIDVRPRHEFVAFRIHDVGMHGGLERLTGKRISGSWATVSWLVEKHHAHPVGDVLVIDDSRDRSIFSHIQPPIVHVLGNIYRAAPRSVARGHHHSTIK